MGNSDNSKLRYVTGKQFKVIASEAQKDADHSNIVIAKAFPCIVRQFDDDAEKRILQFTISTGGVDREGDTINPEGWTNLDTFQKTGVVLWAHDARIPPIAKPLATWVEGDNVKSRAQWLDKDFGDHEHVRFADLIYNMFDKGFMKGVSVGFKPLQYAESMERGGWWPIDYLKQELLEYSAAPVPANAETLHEADKSGLDMAPLKMWAEYVLDDGSTIITVPKAIAGSIHKGLTSASVQVPADVGGDGDGGDGADGGDDARDDDTRGKDAATADDNRASDNIEDKPFPNEHACRLRDPDDFDDDSFVRSTREHDGKEYDVIMAKLNGEESLTDQAFRYNKDVWSESEARDHCVDHDGLFEAAGEASADVQGDGNDNADDHTISKAKLLDMAREQAQKAYDEALGDVAASLDSLLDVGVLHAAGADKLRSMHAKIEAVLAERSGDSHDSGSGSESRSQTQTEVETGDDASGFHEPQIIMTKNQLNEFLTTIKDEVAMRTTGRLPG